MKIQTPAIIGFQLWLRTEYRTEEGDLFSVEYKKTTVKELFGAPTKAVVIALVFAIFFE